MEYIANEIKTETSRLVLAMLPLNSEECTHVPPPFVLPRDRSLVATKHPRLAPGVPQQHSQLLIKLIFSQNIQVSLHQNTI